MAIAEVVTLREVIHLLNNLIALDPIAVKNLVENRVVCNESLCEHETVQTMFDPERKVCLVGVLGVINGLFGVYDDGPKKGYGAIEAVYSDDKDEKILRFRRVKNVSASVHIDESIKED